MKGTIYILFCLLLSLKIFGQDTILVFAKKTQFSIQSGVYYKTFLGDKYIKPTPYYYGDNFSKHQYERFSEVPTFGFDAGLLFSHRFNKHLGITSGLLYLLIREIYETNRDTVIKYGNGSSMRDIHNVFKYDYSFNNIELPLMIQYSVKKFTFYTGCYFSLISYKRATYNYLIDQYPNTPQWTTSDKTVAGWEMPLKILSSIQVDYEIKIKNIKFNPYAAFYYAVKSQNGFYVQLGINFPLIKNCK